MEEKNANDIVLFKTINDFFKAYEKIENEAQVIRPRVVCADGYTASIQAGEGWFSIPRKNCCVYSAVEVGYPSKVDLELLPYTKQLRTPRMTYYSEVPVKIMEKVLKKHGGIVAVDFCNVGNAWEEKTMNNRKRNILKIMKLYYILVDFGRGRWYIKKKDVARKLVFEVQDYFMQLNNDEKNNF